MATYQIRDRHERHQHTAVMPFFLFADCISSARSVAAPATGTMKADSISLAAWHTGPTWNEYRQGISQVVPDQVLSDQLVDDQRLITWLWPGRVLRRNTDTTVM
jgi:hypothetical protein